MAGARKLGSQAAKAVDWSAARLLCIAGDFTRHDEHAVNQIQRQIELLRYRKFGETLLMIELVHAPKVAKTSSTADLLTSTSGVSNDKSSDPYASQRINYRLANLPQEIRDIYEALSTFLAGLGDDVQFKELKYYFAFKRIKNFACVEVFPQARAVTAYLRLAARSPAPSARPLPAADRSRAWV